MTRCAACGRFVVAGSAGATLRANGLAACTNRDCYLRALERTGWTPDGQPRGQAPLALLTSQVQ